MIRTVIPKFCPLKVKSKRIEFGFDNKHICFIPSHTEVFDRNSFWLILFAHGYCIFLCLKEVPNGGIIKVVLHNLKHINLNAIGTNGYTCICIFHYVSQIVFS